MLKTEMYEFDGELYRRVDEVSIVFNVEIHCIQSFLELTNIRPKGKYGWGYTISHEMGGVISNKQRIYKSIRLTTMAVCMYDVVRALGCSDNSEVRRLFEVYRYALDKSREGKMTCVLVWSKNKGYRLQRRNHPVSYKSVYVGDRHLVAMNNTYSY